MEEILKNITLLASALGWSPRQLLAISQAIEDAQYGFEAIVNEMRLPEPPEPTIEGD